MKIKTTVRAGGVQVNHSATTSGAAAETNASGGEPTNRSASKTSGVKVKTSVRAGIISPRDPQSGLP